MKDQNAYRNCNIEALCLAFHANMDQLASTDSHEKTNPLAFVTHN